MPRKARTRPSTEERRNALREALLDAAEQTVASQGLAGLNARDLAREAGCALGAIYNVFPDLDAIVYAVNARTLAAIDTLLAKRRRRTPSRKADTRDAAIAELVALAWTYLDFASANQTRWRALFEHVRWSPDSAPAWYLAALRRLFSLVEAPLATLRPDLSGGERALLARTVFSAVHGVVGLGLDEKLVAVPMTKLAAQTEQLVAALGKGLALAGPRTTRRGPARRKRR